MMLAPIEAGPPEEPSSDNVSPLPPGMRMSRRIALRIAAMAFALAPAVGFGTWVGVVTGRGIDPRHERRDQGPPYSITLSGTKLQDEIGSEMAAVNAARAARHDRSIAHDVLVDFVTFERSAGGVVTRGTVHDLAAPRSLRVVIDAFDSQRSYKASGASVVITGPGPTPFSSEMADSEDYESFGVRFLDGDQEVPKLSKGDPVPGEPPLLLDDGIVPADDIEIVQRLVSLGYLQEPQDVQGEDGIIAVLQRFRRDHGIKGPELVTIGDLLALRAVRSTATAQIDLTAY